MKISPAFKSNPSTGRHDIVIIFELARDRHARIVRLIVAITRLYHREQYYAATVAKAFLF